MATRRSMGLGGEREDDPASYGEDNYEQPVGTSVVDLGSFGIPALSDGEPQIGSVVEPAPAWPPRAPVGVEQDNGAVRGSDQAGNTERGRDFNQQTPTSYGPQFELPQGVTIDEGMFSGVGAGGNSMATPAQSREPNPLSTRTPLAPATAPESGTMRGPMRRSQQSPSLFAQSSSPNLAGRAGGLMGGGLGAVGQGGAGSIKPTEMMQKLLELFRQG